jgi:hypothetical protein
VESIEELEGAQLGRKQEETKKVEAEKTYFSVFFLSQLFSCISLLSSKMIVFINIQ